MGSDESGGSSEAQAEQSDLKRKLAWRMGFAGLLIVILLGTLAVFDRMNSLEETESDAPDTTRPVPQPKKEVTQPVTIAEKSLDVGKDGKEAPETKDSKAVAEPEGSAAPVDKSAPPLEAPPRPQVSAQPRVEVKPEKPDARPSARVVPRSEAKITPIGRSAAAPVPSASLPTPVTPSVPQAPQMPPSQPKLPAQSTPGVPALRAENYPAVARQQPAPPRLFSGYALQAGVFYDLRLAEELHAKLALNGIYSTFEIRVKVGPFKTREEADAAREKLNTLGVDSVLVLPKGVKR